MDLTGTQGELARKQSNSSSHETDRELIRVQDKEQDALTSARVKAAASRASNDEQIGGTNKQMAPAKICLRKSGSRQVTCFTT